MSYNGKYDSTLKGSKKDFTGIVESIITKLLTVDLVESGVNRVYLDVNSAMSIIYRHDDLNSELLTEVLCRELEKFCAYCLNRGVSIYFLFTNQVSLVHKTIEPTWCSERDKRVVIKDSDALKKVLVIFKKYSSNNNNVHVINYKNLHVMMAVDELDRPNVSGSLILSRDPVFRCFFKPNINIYNGIKWFTYEELKYHLPDGVDLQDPLMLPYYMCIRGDSRNEYKGYKGFGSVKTEAYIAKHRIKIKARADHALYDFVKERIALYDLEEMKIKAKELGLSASRVLDL